MSSYPPPPPYGYYYPPYPPPRRRTYWGVGLGAVGVLAALIMLILPVQYSVLGTTVDCGTGFTAWDAQPDPSSPEADDIASRCQSQGRERLLVVVLIGALGLGVGIGVTLYELHVAEHHRY